jgi:hypothetical protein
MYHLCITDFTNTVFLQGLEIEAPCKWAARKPTDEKNPQKESIELFLEGLPASIREFLDGLSMLLVQAGVYESGGVVDPVYLGMQEYNGAEERFSRLVSGSIWMLGEGTDDLAAGRLGVRLNLERVPYWESAETTVSLSNANGSGVLGVNVVNHFDGTAGHENDVVIAGASILGTLAGPVDLTLENTVTAGATLGDVYVGMVSEASTNKRVLEAEDASSGTAPTNSATCSGGKYVSKASGVTPQAGLTMFTWSIASADLLPWIGGDLRPVARFFTAPGFTDLWVWWKITAGVVSWETGRVLLGGSKLEELPVVNLAPGRIAANPADVSLELKIRGNLASYRLDLDCIQFFPAAGLRKYRALGTLAAGAVFEDAYGEITGKDTGGKLVQSHYLIGDPLTVEPGKDQRLFVLHAGAIDQGLVVKVKYKARWAG